MKKTLLVISSITLMALISCQQQEVEKEIPYKSIEYTIYMGGKLAGYQTSAKNQNGVYEYAFEYNDRGRGPKLEEKIELNKEGVIIRHEILGHNYLKDTVSEIYEVDNGIAKWESTSEKGEKPFDNASFFSAINGSLGSSDLLIKKLLSTESKEVNLYPSGTIKITNIDNHKINDSLDLRLVEFTGQSFTPSYVWIDKEDRFFGYATPWFTCIKKGYDSIAKQLEPIQKQKGKDYLTNLAESLVEIPGKQIVIKNVGVFDSKTGKILPNTSVVVEGNKISKVSKDPIESTTDALLIDGTGITLLPGLFDMHTHIGDVDGILHLAAGVTSVRDLGNSSDLPELKENFESDKLIGPRIQVMSGFIDKAGPYAGPTGIAINNLEEGFKAIENYHSKGYRQIKLYSSIEPKWVKPLAEKAHSLSMRVSGHIPSFMLAAEAVKDGYNEIQHSNMVALNFLSDTIDTRTPLRFSMVAEHTHALDFESKEFKDFISLLKSKNIVIDPTVSIFEGMLTTKAGELDPSVVKIVDRLPLSIQRGYYSGGLPIPEGKQEQYKASYNKLLGIVKQLYDHGVIIVPGTDAMAGFSLHTELENYVKAGIPASEVLKIATSVSAEVSGVSTTLGSVEQGKLADLILVDGNPVQNIDDIRKVSLTIKNGNMYRPEKLYNVLGVKHYK